MQGYQADKKRLLLLTSLPKTLQKEEWQTLRASIESEIAGAPIDALSFFAGTMTAKRFLC